MNKKNMLMLSFMIATSLFAENEGVIKNDISQIVNQPQINQLPQEMNRVNEPQSDNEFEDSLANKINSKLEVFSKQIEEAQKIKESSLGIPKSQLLDEKRVEQYLPVMSGSYSISKGNKVLENKALAIDEKEQKYYLDTKNNDLVQNVKEDYLVYKNSETNKPFKSPLVLQNKVEDLKVSTTNTINSVTPIVQDINNSKLPPLNMAVNEEIKKLNN